MWFLRKLKNQNLSKFFINGENVSLLGESICTQFAKIIYDSNISQEKTVQGHLRA